MDCIALVVGILADALDVPVSTEVPADRPSRLVTVSLDGMQDDGFLMSPRIGVTCWGMSDMDAHGMALAVVEELRTAAETHPYLSAVQLETLSRDTWTATGQARYFAELTLTINTDE